MKINLPVPCNSPSRSETHEKAFKNGSHTVSVGGNIPLNHQIFGGTYGLGQVGAEKFCSHHRIDV
jgi:hypothetical protein